ncbi:MAG: hypothetical protein LBQ43_05095 [Holosporales bacterium]|jgi:hypothetical protein|nr:hypothetical protein [Holosporales bacterium]
MNNMIRSVSPRRNRSIVNIPVLNERILLLSINSVADSNGKMKIQAVLSVPSWAYIEPVRWYKNCEPLTSLNNTAMPLFKVLIRARLDCEKSGEADRHIKINALRWKHKEYELVCPFSMSDRSGRFWEALCVERGEEMGGEHG